MSDFEDQDDLPQRNPFQLRWHERILGQCLRTLDGVRFWLIWPLASCANLLAHLGGRLLWLVEWLGYQLQRFVASVAEWIGRTLRLDRVRRQLDGLQDETSRVIGGIGETVRSQTTGSAWLRRVHSALGHVLQWIPMTVEWFSRHLALWASQSVIVRVLLVPFRWVGHFVYLLVDFLLGWLWTRPYRQLWMGIPALVLVLPLAYCAIRLPFYSAEAKSRHYRQAAIDALKEEDFEAAQLFYRKLQQLGDQHERVVFQSALLVAEQGDLDNAYQQIRSIAPADQPGLAEGHLWIARSIAQGSIEQDNPQRMRLLEDHVKHVLALYPGQPDAILLLARVRLSEGNSDEALQLVRNLSREQLSDFSQVELARIYSQLGKTDDALGIAQRLVRQQQDDVMSDPEPKKTEDYLLLAAAKELTGDSLGAVEILFAAQRALPEEDAIRDALVRMGLAYGQQMTSAVEKMDLLRRLYDVAPDSESLLEPLAALTKDPAVATQALELIEQRRAAGTLPAVICRAVGDSCVQRSQWALARTYYQLAVDADSQQDAATNNLAWLLAFQEPVDLPRALALADRAVKLVPTNPHYRETRGQILIQLERWGDAASELEIALNGMPDSKPIHQSLALAYEKLGRSEAARMHRQLAASP